MIQHEKIIRIILIMNTLNNIKVLEPWNIADAVSNTHNSEAKFVVKLIHVDKYRSYKNEENAQRKDENIVSYSLNDCRKKCSQTYRQGFYNKQRGCSVIVSSKMLKQIGISKQKLKKDMKMSIKRQYFELSSQEKVRTKSLHKTKNIYACQTKNNNSPRPIKQKRSNTETIYGSIRRFSEGTSKDYPINKTFHIQTSKYAPKQRHMVSMNTQPQFYGSSQLIELKPLKSPKRLTTTNQLLYYRPDKLLRKKEIIVNKFRTTLNRAKLNNHLISAREQFLKE